MAEKEFNSEGIQIKSFAECQNKWLRIKQIIFFEKARPFDRKTNLSFCE